MIAPSHPAHVLVLDGSPFLLDLFREILETAGYRVSLRVRAGGLAEIERIDPDLVILDLVFGAETDGVRLLQAMKTNPATASLPIVVCSGAVEAIRQLDGWLVGGATELVLKPFDNDELLGAVARALHQAGAERDRCSAPVRG